MSERREGIRVPVPELYGEYITFKIRNGAAAFVPAVLLDFSLSGIRMRNPFPLSVGSEVECVISMPKVLTKEVPFRTKVKYSVQHEESGDYVIGAEIVPRGDNLWLDLFSKVHDYIKERLGEIF